MDQEKRALRKEKRAVKKAGVRSVRRALKRDLDRNPEEAAFTEVEFGAKSSKGLNGLDEDKTRQRE
jgi:hypothetical protein